MARSTHFAEPWPRGREFRVLVPIIRAQTATPLMDVGDALVSRRSGSGEVLGLVEIPGGTALGIGEVLADRRRDLLRWIAATDRAKPGAKLAIQIRVAHSIARGIREVVYENESNLIVIEWPGLGTQQPRRLTAVLRDLAANPPADLILVRPDPWHTHVPTRARILVPIRGGGNAGLAIEAGLALAEAHDGTLTLLHALDLKAPDAAVARAEESLSRLAGRLAYPQIEVAIRRAGPGGAILGEAANHDVTIVGAQAQETASATLVSSTLAESVRQLPGTVIIAKRASR